MKNWTIVDGKIYLTTPDGSTSSASSREVIGAEFKDKLKIRNHQIDKKPSDDLPNILFERFAPEVLIKLFPPSPDLAVPAQAQIWIRHDNQFISRLNIENLTNDALLIGDRWLPLDQENAEGIRHIFTSHNLSGDLTVRQYVNLLAEKSDLVLLQGSSVAESGREASNEAITLPPNFTATLYPYQTAGVRWLSRIVSEEMGCILGDEMGLGKTIQVIAVLASQIDQKKTPCLVVTTATLMENWRREFLKFTTGIRTLVHRGSGRTGFPNVLRDYDVVITTYDTAVRDQSLFKMIDWNVVALDEAQAIKTPIAQRSEAAKQIPRKVSIAVTGTPVENRLTDLWSLMDFCVPGFLGTLRDFESAYNDDPDAAAQLEPIVTPLMLRRRVSEVATDLPARIDIPQAIEMSESAANRYEEIRSEIEAEYGKMASLVSIIKLRLFCTHPFLVDEAVGDPAAASTKYSRLLEIIDEIMVSNEKFLIFTSFTDMADLLHADLTARYRIPGYILDGRSPIDGRQSAVDQFQAHETSAFMVLNPKAAGVGLNITAANHVIHYNLEWNPALEDQATARAFRRGQTRPVTVHRLFHAGTIEEVIDQRTHRKREIAGAAVIGVEGKDEDIADIVRAIELSPVRKAS